MDNQKTFKELYLAGEVEFEAIDDYSYEWGISDEECTLAQYLGLNAEEEDAWVSDSEDALREMLDKQKNKYGESLTVLIFLLFVSFIVTYLF